MPDDQSAQNHVTLEQVRREVAVLTERMNAYARLRSDLDALKSAHDQLRSDVEPLILEHARIQSKKLQMSVGVRVTVISIVAASFLAPLILHFLFGFN